MKIKLELIGYNSIKDHKYRIKMGDYYFIYKPYFKYSNSEGYVSEHRYIYHLYLSIKYNRIIYLPRSYHIHHIDEDTFNNKISNLQILTRSKHKSIHNPIIDRTHTFCNICKSKTSRKILVKGKYYTSWVNDINGHLCFDCYAHIYTLRKKFGIM